MAIIEVAGLGKRYGPKVAVDDVSFTVDEGEIFGVLGPNGAGKTTTVECKDLLGVQLQESELPERIKVKEAVELFAGCYRDPVDWTERLGLKEHRDTEFAKLSGGLKQRLNVALALVARGCTNRDAAAKLFISEATVKTHLRGLLR